MKHGKNYTDSKKIVESDKLYDLAEACEVVCKTAKAKGIHGKDTTPFLLDKIKTITGGHSLDSNIQLVFNNARLAAKTAGELCKL